MTKVVTITFLFLPNDTRSYLFSYDDRQVEVSTSQPVVSL